MDTGPTGRFRTTRNMPSWVTESSDRVGPPPPPPPVVATDPEYEVIDVANQQYSNAPPPVPLKSPDIKRLTVMKCDLCGSVQPIVRCEQCDSNLFCASCDDRYHRHPKRQTHARKILVKPSRGVRKDPIEPVQAAPGMVKPPLPPKGEAGVGGPLPPPRKNKRPGSFHFPSPMLGRKQDQTIPTTVPQGQLDQQQQQQQQKPPPPPPSPALSLREKMNSLKRFIHPSNRPLPDPPENKIHSSNSSLDTVSKRSPSIGPASSMVSSTMKKIQNNTAATLDRMTLLQQRYRQHQETMKSGDGDRSRRASLTSNTDLQSSATESSGGVRSRPTSATFHPQPYPYQQQHQPQFLPSIPSQQPGVTSMHPPQLQSRWLNPPAPRMRSGSVASGINLLPGAPQGLTPVANNAPPMSISPTQRSEFGDSPPMMPNAPRSLSTSVFNLHQPPPQQPNMWGFNPLHQAQSMAHFNPMQWNQMNAWMARGSQNGSNMSLNLPSPSPHGYPQDPSGYPPAWPNAWGGMYPYPMGMMPMMPGVAMPPPRSRANSRSRAASPALSVKSRKSTISMRNLNRSSFVDDLTDDEDSDDEFRRGRGRGTDRRRRERLNSTSSIDFDEPEPNHAFVRASSVKHSRFNRDRRGGGGSSARSLIDYPVSRKPASSVGRYEREELARDRLEKMTLAAPRKVPSDSFTNESDQEPEGNRRGSSAAAGRGRSSNDGFSSPRKITSDSLTNDSDADFERRRQAKLRAAQNNLAANARRPPPSDSPTNDSEPDHNRRRQVGKPTKPSNTSAAPSKKLSSDSDGRDKPQRKISSESKTSGGKAASVPKKIPSDSHTPDTDGEQKRRFASKQQRQRKHSSTEFIANDSDEDRERNRSGAQTEAKKEVQSEKSVKQQRQQQPTQKVVNGLLEFRTISPSKSDSDEQRHLKTVEIKNIINEEDTARPDGADYGRSVPENSPPPPAPVAPNREWQCEFCTYVNEAGVKICAICCKTATIGAVMGDSKQTDGIDSIQSRSPPPDVVQEAPHVTEVKLQIVPPQKPASPAEAKKKDDAGRSDVDDEEDHETDTGMTVGVGGFDSQGHTARLASASAIATDAADGRPHTKEGHVEKKVVKEKVSTGCGPSPPREIIVEPKRATVMAVERAGSKASTGTSPPPPPQDMSTQTYDTIEQVREEIAALEQTSVENPINRNEEETRTASPQRQDRENVASSLYKRSYSLATPQLLQVDRPASRNSISSDTQSLPPSPHELSPQPGLQSSTRFQANTALNQTSHPHQPSSFSSPSSAHYGQRQDDTLSYLDRAIHQILQTAANQSRSAGRPPVVDSKYRTFGDLRQIVEEQPSTANVAKGHPEQPQKTMRPTTMDDQIDQEESIQRSPLMPNGSGVEEPESEMTQLLKEAERYHFTAEELQAALTHCGEKHPVQWLRGNWNKLIETVQTLATKYGHEKRENTIGTISTTEAREALRLHRGNIWRAITECIEQRQRKYREIASKGNFTREDIVTSLTAHHGNLEQAMVELSKTQLKPFLMRIWGPPSGADNDCGNLPLLQQALKEDRSGISSDIQNFISAHVEQELLGDGSSGKLSDAAEAAVPVIAEESPERVVDPDDQTELEIAALASSADADQREEVCEEQTTNSFNTEILKDIEALILQMERNQESANAPMLRNIQQLLTQLTQVDHDESHGSRAPSVASVRSQASDQRIMSKSPIPVVRPSTIPHQAHLEHDTNRTIEDDVRHFVEQNIQDILPNLVQQVRQEMDSIHEDRQLTKPLARTLENDIRETLLRADYTDSDYSNIHYFPFEQPNDPPAAFPERQTVMKEVTPAVEDEQEYANIQQFLRRAINNERTTTAFDRYKRKHYQFDSSSDEARQTADSTDYYDLVSINEKLMNLFNKVPVNEQEPEQDAHTIAQPAEEQAKQTIVMQVAVEEQMAVAKVDTEQQQPSTSVVSLPVAAGTVEKIQPQPGGELAAEKKGMKKRRGVRAPNSKGNYLSRRPVKSSSESDFEGLAHSAQRPIPTVGAAIDHVNEMRHVVENIEQIEKTIEAEVNDHVNGAASIEPTADDAQQMVDEPIYINLPSKPEPIDGDERRETEEPQPIAAPSNEIVTIEQPVPVEENQQHDSTSSVAVETPALLTPAEERQAEENVAVPLREDMVAEASSQETVPIKDTKNIATILDEPQPMVANGVDSQNHATEAQVNGVQNGEVAQDEVLVHSAKLSNNLSELVLDTKRLIQQMKDEINSDIATFNEDDAAYEDDFYEDEYEDEWEGEEEEEWDSNEEYDVDENGDFLEYEDDDDDGSVMFSEMTIIDSTNGKSRSIEQAPDNQASDPVREPIIQEMILPKINLAVVRENERNSASEVSDLPLDSDFNDALSVIEHSVSEMRNMLQLTEEALGPLPDLARPLHHASSVETLQNSPEQSEISEVTLVPDQASAIPLPPEPTDESSEQTLVAEENQPQMTMKEVQTLLNAKAVIGGFLKNVQKIEQTNQLPTQSDLNAVELPEVANLPAVIYDSVKTTSTETTENRPASVIERNTGENYSQLAAIDQNQLVASQDVNSAPGESLPYGSAMDPSNKIPSADTFMESAHTNSSVSVTSEQPFVEPRSIPAQLQQPSMVQNGPNAANENNDDVPVIATTIQEATEHDELEEKHASQENILNSTIPEAASLRMIETAEENKPPTTDGTDNVGFESKQSVTQIQPSVHFQQTEGLGANITLPEYVNVEILQPLTATESNVPSVPDYATVVKAGSKLRLINGDSSNNAQNDHQTHDVTDLTVGLVPVIPSTAVHPVENSGSLIAVEDTQNLAKLNNTTEFANDSTTQNSKMIHISETFDPPVSLKSVNSHLAQQPALSDPFENMKVEELVAGEPAADIQVEHVGEVKEITAAKQADEHLAEPALSNATGISDNTKSESNESNTNHASNPKDDMDVPPIPSHGASEDESSICTEVQPSQVIVHSPHPSLPETPPRTTNIYQNVNIQTPGTIITPNTTATNNHSSVGRKKVSSKLTVKITNAKTLQSDDGTSPTTLPATTGSKASNAKPRSTKTDPKKKITGSPTSTTPNTTTISNTDSSGRKQPTLVRKKSIGSPFGTVNTNSVKALQKEFLTKVNVSPKPSTSKVSLKPSKITQPKVFTGDHASSSGSGSMAGSSKASTPGSSARSTPGSLAAESEAGPSSSAYTYEKLMKKKYRETCFSDDYQTTDDEEESRMTTTESERTIIKSLIKPYEPDNDPPEIQAKKLLEDGLVQNAAQAELAVQLIELRYVKESAIWAASQSHTIDEAKNLLQKECELCLGVLPMNEIVAMLKCTHNCCHQCAKEYFTQEITNRSITNCNCPFCKEPDLNRPDVTEDEVLEYFSNLDILLKSIVDEEVHDLFQRKLRDRTLMRDPNFKWCVQCSSGFIARPKQRRLTCPDCGSITCASCRKPWESQHEGISCEKFAAWKEANDPELQAEGVQKHLQAHGISCPQCKFRYSLARGGCMHFTCTQCKFEFCYGCNKPFMMGAKCSVSAYCAKFGLHAHHPRNCLFYLRDKEPGELQNLLMMNNVPFDTEPSEQMKQEHTNGQYTIPKCPIPLQKETPAGLMDMICSGEVPPRHAGLCRTHYVEYLVGTVSKAQIDPLPILDLNDCVLELRRRGIPLPERGPWDTDQIYRQMCQKIVKDQIPLN